MWPRPNFRFGASRPTLRRGGAAQVSVRSTAEARTSGREHRRKVPPAAPFELFVHRLGARIAHVRSRSCPRRSPRFCCWVFRSWPEIDCRRRWRRSPSPSRNGPCRRKARILTIRWRRPTARSGTPGRWRARSGGSIPKPECSRNITRAFLTPGRTVSSPTRTATSGSPPVSPAISASSIRTPARSANIGCPPTLTTRTRRYSTRAEISGSR